MSIPKKIHYCWFGRNPKPELALKCIASWRKFCPDFEIIEWNEDNMDIASFPTYVRQAYEKKAWGFVPDYLRLWIVYHYGGIYLDTDVQLLKSLEPLLEEECFAGSEDGEHVSLGLGFGADKGNQIIRENMQVYEALSFVYEDGSLNRTPSPQYSTGVLREFGLPEKIDKVTRIKGFVCFPPEYFCPKSFETGLTTVTKNTYSIHHFDGSWCDEEQIEWKNNRWKAAKRDYWIHLPNRILMKLLGDSGYSKLKKFLKRG